MPDLSIKIPETNTPTILQPAKPKSILSTYFGRKNIWITLTVISTYALGFLAGYTHGRNDEKKRK